MNKEMIKGTTDIIILNLLNREPMYGYGLIKSLSILTRGLFELKEGTLYPILHSLEEKGYIESYWQQKENERKRKYYKITEDGTTYLVGKQDEWNLFSETLTGLLEN